jgi:putative colanic acid biosynthesis UDP-glucose lipid carrier transferase
MTDFDTATGHILAAGRPQAPVANCSLKRSFDIAVALVALVVLAPLLLLVAIAIFVEDGGPILFRQRRTGLGGEIFTILKFRSMRVAEDGVDIRQATKADERITRVGSIIRPLSIDELPQLINVLRGDMSFVGPRPHAVSHDHRWSGVIQGYAGRFRARPGLTGYAQVCGLRGEVRELTDIEARIAADNYYVENWSIPLEMSIIFRTIPLLFHDPRAY